MRKEGRGSQLEGGRDAKFIDFGIPFVSSYYGGIDATVRIVKYSNAESTRPALLFVPGWGSTPWSWRRVIPVLAGEFDVYYFETREKGSAIARLGAPMGLAAMSQDLIGYLNSEQIDFVGFVGASTGANLILEAWSLVANPPRWIALIAPNATFKIPAAIEATRLIPRSLLKHTKWLAVAILRAVSYTKREKTQIQGTVAALSAGDLDKLRRSAHELRPYKLSLEQLSLPNCPMFVVGATADLVHDVEAALKIVEKNRLYSFYDAVSFTGAHSSKTAKAILAWLLGKASDG
jgi:pimeloyl-ACP methyl ester carboxylesterase